MRLRTNQSARVRAHRMLLLIATLISVAIILGGCDENISGSQDGPGESAGSYTLADVGGNPLPTMIYEGPLQVNGQLLNVRLDIRGSTLQLDGARYTLSMQLNVTAESGTAPFAISDQGQYRQTGDRIEFQSQDMQVGNFAGTLRGTALTVSIDLVGDKHPPTFLFRK